MTMIRAESFNLMRSATVFTIALIVLLVLTWLVYCPGLNGTFLFDDFVNLDMLGATGPIHNWPSFLRYVTSGSADPTGRPITLLTFLLDAQDWPASPYAFKRTNVLLHLLNVLLLCWAMLKLGDRTGLREAHKNASALLGSGIWALHPFLVSTTLYIVQREAMLPATFSLLGLLCWCTGRTRLDENRIGSAWAWMATGSFLCTLLAILCKANGALLPLLIATAECTVLRPSSASAQTNITKTLRQQRLWLLGIPIAILVVYLLSQFPAYIQTATDKRPWTVGQRLLSEPRVLMSYLRLLWLPRSTSEGVFNDQVVASANWFTPWTTLPCIISVLSLCTLGCLLRKRKPIIAFGLLFYFAGHVMESTFVPLELFFEHRNYLPAAFMFWPLAVWLTDNKAVLLRHSLAAIVLCILAILTRTNTQVWGNAREQALIWGQINPESARAQAFAASAEMNSGHYVKAMTRLRATLIKEPNEAQLSLNLVGAECVATGRVYADTWKRALYSLEHTTNTSHQMFDWFVNAIQIAKAHSCNGITLQNIHQALEAAKTNALYGQQPGPRQDFAHVSGLLALAEQQPQVALDDFNQAFLYEPTHDVALAQAAALGAAGYPEFGLRHLTFAQARIRKMKFGSGMPRVHDWLLSHQGYWQHETETLRTTLAADAAK